MRKLVFLLLVIIMYSCNNSKKESGQKVVEVKFAKKYVPENVYAQKSDSLLNLLEKGEIEPEEVIPTKTTTLASGESFNEFLETVNVNGINIYMTTREEFLDVMSSPDSITKEPNFVGDDGGFEEIFWYKKSYFKTFDGRVQTVDISDKEFIVNGFLRVGMNEQLIEYLFPESYKLGRKAESVWRYEGKGYDMEYAIFRGDDLLSVVTKDGKIARMVYIYSI